MQIGSLVKCIKTTYGIHHGKKVHPTREVGNIGIVKSMDLDCEPIGILVDDDPEVKASLGYIIHRNASYWREIQPPMDIPELLKESINEPVTA